MRNKQKAPAVGNNNEIKTARENTDGKKTRTYSLAKKSARKEYDLRMFKDVITDTVQGVIPGVQVDVKKDSYTVHGIDRGEAIAIGRQLSSYFSEAALVKAVIFVSTQGEMFREDELYYQQDTGKDFR